MYRSIACLYTLCCPEGEREKYTSDTIRWLMELTLNFLHGAGVEIFWY
jgi:hypothetical protein